MKQKNTNQSSIVHINEREGAKGIRFYLQYTIGGTRQRELLEGIPVVKRTERIAYREARAAAEAIMWERTKEIRSGQLGMKTPYSNLLLTDWINTVAKKAREDERPGMNRHTWSLMIERTGEMIKTLKPNIKVVEVDKQFLLDFINYLKHEYKVPRGNTKGKPLAPKTADKYYSCLRHALNEALKNDIITVNPCAKLSKSDRIQVSTEEERGYLTIEELQRFAAAETKHTATKNAFLFMCFTGLRISDLRQLKWENIEKHGDNWHINIKQQKTQEQITIPISSKAKVFIPEPPEGEEQSVVFYNIPSDQKMNKWVKEIARAAGITKKVTLHVARHTCGTTLLTMGADLYTTSKILGHTNIKTTQIYAKIVDKKKEEAVNLLNNIL